MIGESVVVDVNFKKERLVGGNTRVTIAKKQSSVNMNKNLILLVTLYNF